MFSGILAIVFLGMVDTIPTCRAEIKHTAPLLSFAADGTIVYRAYDARANILVDEQRNYSIKVCGSCWWISTRPRALSPETAVSLYEVASDGSNIFALTHLNQPHEQANTSLHSSNRPPSAQVTPSATGSTIKTRNQAVAEVYRGTVPNGDASFAAPLWLAYASADCIRSATAGRLPKVWLDGEKSNPYTLRAEWVTNHDMLGLPVKITYYNEGYRHCQAPDGKYRTAPEAAPFDKGFVEGQFIVCSFTNFGSIIIPTQFRIEQYYPVSGATNASQVRVLTTVDGSTTYIGPGPASPDLRPLITSATAVQDSHLHAGEPGAEPGVRHFLTNEWPTEDQLAGLVSKKNNGTWARSGGPVRFLQRCILAATLVGGALAVLHWVRKPAQAK